MTQAAADGDARAELRATVRELRHTGHDTAVERRLVDLRRSVGDQLVEGASDRLWEPEIGPELDHELGAVPVVAPDALTAEIIGAGLRRHGAIHVPGLFDDETVGRIRDGMEHTFEDRAEGDAGSGDWFSPYRPFFQAGTDRGDSPEPGKAEKPDIIRLVDSPRVMHEFVQSLSRAGVVEALQGYLGEHPLFTVNKAVLRYLTVPELIFGEYHQDGRFMGEDMRAANVWVAMDDCGTDAPGLDIVPRREQEIWPTDRSEWFDWTITEEQVSEAVGDDGVQRLQMRAGDALLFDHFLVHRSALDTAMTKMRRAVECWFFRAVALPARLPAAGGLMEALPEIRERMRAFRRGELDEAAERGLPGLRRRAAAELAQAAPSGRWRPEVGPELVHDPSRLPVIGREAMDAPTVAAGVRHHGALVVESFLSSEQVADVQAGMDEALKAHDADLDAVGPWHARYAEEEATAKEKGKPDVIRLVDSPRNLSRVLQLFTGLGAVGIAQTYLGQHPVITTNKAVMRFVEVPRFLPRDYHQDGRFMGGDIRALNLWVALDDCGTDAPSLDLIPRREERIHPTGRAKGFDWTITEDQVTELVGADGVQRLQLRAGDAVWFDHFLVHRTACSHDMAGMRRAIECWFFAPSTCPGSYQPMAV